MLYLRNVEEDEPLQVLKGPQNVDDIDAAGLLERSRHGTIRHGHGRKIDHGCHQGVNEKLQVNQRRTANAYGNFLGLSSFSVETSGAPTCPDLQIRS